MTIDPQNGQISWTPDDSHVGDHSISLKATDISGLFDVQSFNIIVDNINNAPFINPISVNPINEDFGLLTINFTGLDDGDSQIVQNLSLTATSSNLTVVPQPIVNFTPNNSYGSLEISSLPGINGSSTIILKIFDDGGIENGGIDSTIVTFDVVVLPVNDEPTITGIENPAPIYEDSGEQLISFSGVGDGELELDQNLAVTAFSSDINIIPNPTINYVPNETTGTLSYIPVPNANGMVTITVIVSDDGGTNNGGDNTKEISFDVEVTPINDPPIASAGPDQTVNVGDLVSLDGSASYDIENDPITYMWSSPSEISLSDPSSVNPNFVAPATCIHTEYLFTIVVNDGEYPSEADSVIITVLPNSPEIVSFPNSYSDTLTSGTQKSEELLIKNIGICDLEVNVTSDATWISNLPLSETIVPTDSVWININLDASGLIPGDYMSEISITSNDPNSLQTDIPISLKVLSNLSLTVEIDPDEVCAGSAVQLNAMGSGGFGNYSYSWTSDPPGFSSALQNPIDYPSTTTTYSVEVTDGYGITLSSIEVIAYQDEAPSPAVNLIPLDATYNIELPIQFSWDLSSNASGYDLYIWRTNQEKPENPTVADVIGDSYVYTEYLNKNYLYNWQVEAKNLCPDVYSESAVHVFSFYDFPDLTVTEVNFPNKVFSGDEIDVSFTILNNGLAGTEYDTWHDDVYLSSSPIFDEATAIKLGTIPNNSQLGIGDSYTNTSTFLTDQSLEGLFYIFVLTDGLNVIQETNEMNNILGSAGTLEIEMPPFPDLWVRDVQALSTAVIPDSTLSVGWIVENIGDTIAAGGWSQKVSLVSGEEKMALGYVQYTSALEASGIISQSTTFDIPEIIGLEGDVFVEVELTPYPELVEKFNSTSNNIALSNNSIVVEKKLFISLPEPSIDEDGSPMQCMVLRSGNNAESLSVSINVSESNRIGLPTSVLIPANQSGVMFTVSAIDNELIEGNVDLTITAQAIDYPLSNIPLTVVDDEVPSLFLSSNVESSNEGDIIELTVSRNLITANSVEIDLIASLEWQIVLPDNIEIQAGAGSIVFDVEIVNDAIPELDLDIVMSASAAGFFPGMDTIIIIDDDIPTVELILNPDSVSESGGPYASWGTVKRLEPGDSPIIIQLSSDPIGDLYFPSEITIPAGMMQQQFNIGVTDNGILDGNREIEITAALYISSCGCSTPPESIGTATSTLTIIDDDGLSLVIVADPFVSSEGITNAGNLEITRNTVNGDEITINLTHNGNDEIDIPGSVILPTNEDMIEVPFSTLDDGIEDGDQVVSITVSSDGYSSGSCWVMVSDQNLPDYVLTEADLSENTMYVNDEVEISMYVLNEGNAIAADGATVNIYQSENDILDENDMLLSTQFTQSVINIGDSIEVLDTLFITGNVGDFYIIVAINENEQLNELIGINNTSDAEPLSLLPDFTATVTVDGDLFNGSTPIIINGITEAVTKDPVPNKQVDVYVVVDGVRRVFSAESDMNGEFSVSFVPLNGEAGEYYVGACFPGEGLNVAQDEFTIVGAKHTETDFIIWDLWHLETKPLFLEIKNFSDIALNNVNVEILSAPTGCNLSFTPVSSLPGGSFATINYTVEATEVTAGTQYEEVKLALTSAEGTIYEFSAWFFCRATTGNLRIDPVVLNTTMVKDQVNYREFEVTNIGLDTTGLINISLPEVDWMSLASADSIPSLDVGESAVVTLRLSPGEDIQLNNPVTGNIVLSATNSSSTGLPFSIMPISVETGSLLVDVVDEYTYNTQEAPHLEGATVVITHPYTGEIVAQGISDMNGYFLADDINEGYYTLTVQAEQHGAYQDYIYIEKGIVNNELVFLPFQAITYTWEVVPTEIEDEYEIELVVEYETNIPAPVVVMNMPDTMPHLEQGEFYPFLITLTNEGLITAKEVELTFPDDEEYMFTTNVDLFDLLPNQSVQVPVIMERKPNKNFKGYEVCVDYALTAFKFECGPDDQLRIVSSFVYFEGRVCTDYEPYTIPIWYPPTGGGGGGNGPIDPLWDVTCGWCEWLSQPSQTPYESSNIGCNPCVAEALNCLWNCINPIPTGAECAAGLVAEGLRDDYTIGTAASCGVELASYIIGGSLSCAWCTGTTIGCFINEAIGNNSPQKLMKSAELEQVNDDMLMLQKGYGAIAEWGGEMYGNSELLTRDYFHMFNDSVAEFLDNKLSIGQSILNGLIISFQDTDITENEILEFVTYWNSTMEAQSIGIYSPTPDYPNILDTLLVHEYKLQLDTAIQYTHDRGYPSLDSLYNYDIVIVESYLEEESSSVCATVTVQFSQNLTMTREAFEGTLTIFNGHETDAMENISLDLEVRDEDGNIRNDLFQINTMSLDQITGIDGSGILDALVSGTAVILFIPEVGAAPDVPKYYSFGGTLSYLDPFTGEMYEQPLFPVTLQVNPSPYLYLDYFMQRNIFGDDALTEAVEPMIPAELAVMIDNQGAGTAKNAVLESAQPEIIENEKGLLVDFEILGSNLGGQPMQLGLYDVDFGDIEGGEIAIGQWWFTSTLLGHFISYEASVKHLDSYGNPDLSLIGGVEIHELIKSISVYGPLDDTINDFLVNDLPDVDDIPDALYYSNGIIEQVVLATNSSVDGPVTLIDTIVELTMEPSLEGWNYTVLDDPGNGFYRIVSVTRDDGQEIPLNNIWLTYSTIPDGGEPIYENKMHFVDTFDENASTDYTIVFEPKDQDIPSVVEINGAPEDVTDLPVELLEIVFSEPIDSTSFTFEDMTLQWQGGENLMDSLVEISKMNDTTYTVDISGKTDASGFYAFTAQAAGIFDLVGNNGDEGKQVSWTQAFDIPAIDMFIGLPDEQGDPIDTLLVQFNMPIIESTFTIEQLILYKIDGDTLLTENLIIEPISVYGSLYKIGGLLPLTTLDGTYKLTIVVTDITGENGEIGMIDQSVQWDVCQVTPPVVNAGENDTICQNQLYQLFGYVENASSFLWTSSGTGDFDDSQSLSPIYTPGQNDIDNGFVELSLTANPMGNCSSPQSASMSLNIYKHPVAIAGSNAVIFYGETYHLAEAFASDYLFVEWSTDGGGTFDSIGIINPTYYPAIDEFGNVTLTLKAVGFGTCDTAFSNLTLEIEEGYDLDLDLKVFLQGSFFNGQMIPFLNVFGYLPLEQPYNRAPWYYSGKESIDLFSSFNIIDWVLIEVIQFTDDSHYNVIGRKAGFLNYDGQVADLDGTSLLNVKVSDTSNLSVCIQHRNHLKIISSHTISNQLGVYKYDFTTNPDNAIGGQYSLFEVTNGVWGMLAGNGNGDDVIDNRDKNDVWLNEKGGYGYKDGDFNMDSQVDTDDKLVKWKPNSGKGIRISN